MKKNQKQINKELLGHSKKLAKKTLLNYIKYSLPLFFLEISISITLFFLANKIGKYVNIPFVIINLIVFSMFAVIFDGGAARELKKANFQPLNSKITKEQGIVFYNGLKIRFFLRGAINLAYFIIILLISIFYFVL